ncbi:MAG: hypothetical protein H5U26_12170 [Immundisolibacter sp.]|uniref:hypothetical protein n=1 Tax=Immundisolibacter sp. TaxID=1934948 RepID=UPI00199BDF54|nr:hypothetical protein [Immundisolibacter sp.]MBC7162847.1 hypothetical protein [Immundisolibacter sp.]
MTDSAAGGPAYLARLGITGEQAQRLLVGLSDLDVLTVAQLQARLAQAMCGADQAAGPADADCAWLRAAVQRAYGLPVPAPQRALMPALLPLRRQHMTAHTLHRGFVRQLLGMFLYRPAARVLRRLQLLIGHVERP